jgi:GT2 family glycosyltransferase
MLVSREVFDAIGLLDEDFFFSFEDLDLCLRAKRAGFSTVLAASTFVHHEGGRSIGAGSPQRLYYAARNHLLLAHKAAPARGLADFWGALCVVLLNVAYAVRAPGGSLAARLGAVGAGVRDYAAGRFGESRPGR